MDPFEQSLYLAQRANQLSAVQLHVLTDIRGSLRSMSGKMRSLRAAQMEGIAIQQAAMQREIFQDKIEEFVYQMQKAINAFQQANSDFPPSSQYFFLRAVFATVEQEGIATAVIKGRDNKLAFDDGMSKARALYRQLERNPEVRQALAWAEGEEQKRLAEAKKCEVAVRSIKGKIEHLRQSRQKADFIGWYKRKFAWVDDHPEARYFIHILLWLFGGYLWIPLWYRISASSEEANQNASIDGQIRQLEERLQSLEASQQLSVP
jgi:hypothetical protein